MRDRPEDIPLLTRQLLQSLAEKAGLDQTPDISNDAIESLMEYSFPGNVRELENILERALALVDNNKIESSDLEFGRQMPQSSDAIENTIEQAVETTNPLDLEGQEKSAIMQALEKTRWNKTAAAKLLGLSLRQLRYRLQKFGID